jgi:hypothetical protein
MALCLCAVLGQAPAAPSRAPVQAEFLKQIDVRNLTAGATLLARVTADWSSPGCVLHQGAILEGTVETLQARRGHDTSTLAVSFNGAQCGGKEIGSFPLVLVALAEPPADFGSVPEMQIRVPPNVFARGVTMGELRSPNLDLAGITHHFPAKANVRAGDVLGLRGIKLDVGKGPKRSSVVSSVRADVILPTFTQMLLMPASEAFVAAPSAVADSAPLPHAGLNAAPETGTASVKPATPPPPVAAPVPEDTLSTCAPPGCKVDMPVAAADLQGRTRASIALGPVGYIPRTRRTLKDFDDDQTLSWLGGDQLLFTFNSRGLVRRGSDRVSGRVVRAVLVHAPSRAVIRVVDWEIRDRQRYVWQLDPTHILVHVGNELRVYGAGLEVERTLALAGPLAFLRPSPNGELVALATIRERHSPDLHAKLRDDLAKEPEEDIDIAVVDKDFNVIATTRTVTGLMPPTLLNEGQVRILARSTTGYRLALDTWQDKSATLARFESLCTPRLSSIAPDLLFLTSCSSRAGGMDYRVLRADGKLMLRGTAAPLQFGIEVSGNGRRFALKSVKAARDVVGLDFTGTDLESQEVRVYNAEDGKRLTSVRVTEPVTSRTSYALSPDGSQLAVLSGSEIQLFDVPADPARNEGGQGRADAASRGTTAP